VLTYDEFCAQVAAHFDTTYLPLIRDDGFEYRAMVERKACLTVAYCTRVTPRWVASADKVPNAYGRGDTLQAALDNFKVSVVEERDKAVQMHDAVLEVLT
jgi:hypothetical protein